MGDMATSVGKAGKGNLEAKYPRVYQDIRARIENGILSGALPSARELATDYGVNFMTVNKALKKLESDGLVTCVPRKGTYVKRRYCVAAYFNDTCPNLLRVPIYNGVVMAAQQYFLKHHYPMYLESSPLEPGNTDSLRSRVDGMLLFYNETFPLDDALLQLPFVRVMGNSGADLPGDYVSYDNAMVGHVAADYLCRQGCRNIAYIGPHVRGIFTRRRESFAERVTSNGACYVDHPLEWSFNSASVGVQVEAMLAAPEQPDGIFAPNDSIMSCVCGFLYRRGIDPFEKYRLIGCDNDTSFRGVGPEMFPSIDLRVAEIGRLAAERLIKRMENPDLPTYKALLEPKLVAPDTNDSSHNMLGLYQ
jgi:DNA-binding LacI/PurR family transcriptional regulator